MSFLDRFRRWSSPTREWRSDPRVPRVIDLDAFTLCGVELGAPYDRLSFLGPSDSPFFDWHEIGLTVDIDIDTLGAFTASLSPEAAVGSGWPRGAPAFPGRIRVGGAEVEAAALSEDVLTAAWGPPYWEDVDDEEVLLFYERHGVEVQLELSPAREARVVTVTADPLLADPEQRAAYGVERPWPPIEAEA